MSAASVTTRIYPAGMLYTLSRNEVERLQDVSRGDLAGLVRRCALAVLNSGNESDDAEALLGVGARKLEPARAVAAHEQHTEELCRPDTSMEGLAKLKPSFAMMGEMGGFDAVALQKYHWVEGINHVHTPGTPSRNVDGAALTFTSDQAKPRDEAEREGGRS